MSGLSEHAHGAKSRNRLLPTKSPISADCDACRRSWAADAMKSSAIRWRVGRRCDSIGRERRLNCACPLVTQKRTYEED